MAAFGQDYFRSHLHANPAFFLPLDFNLRQLLLLLHLVSPPVLSSADLPLFPLLNIAYSPLKLQKGGEYHT